MNERRNLLLAILLLTTAARAAQEHNAKHSWDYGEGLGPSHWGDLRPEFATCKTGHRQSPIDIRNPQKSDLPPIRFDYKPSPLHIIDNGHTIMVNYAPGSSIFVGGQKYGLKQFHFHRPSEEKINGKTFAMTVHLVHADEKGKLAVVAVLLQQGEDNPLMRELWKDLPREQEKEERLDNIEIDASRILPSNGGYYTFSGSLTTPPCSEDVTWFVLKHPVTVSAEGIEQFSQLYRNNVRPTQPLYDRIVLESQ
ncbi:MAG TPA: carbonic anhydrase family protein [Candidatus Acidoferrum sp.]|nr:carbonic anhydrase family protein [Candidatus Acidoferrum sp.]